MNDHWVQELQFRCSQIGRSLDNLRSAVLARLPAQQRTPPHSEISAIHSFFDPPPPPQKPATAATATATAGGITKEEIGRASWLFLHTLAAQYPNAPTRQQRRDAKTLIDVLTRMYPCGECAQHFKQVVAAHPPKVGSQQEFSQWMCQVHNVVNRSLEKPAFNCDLVDARWAGLGCGGGGGGGGDDACSLEIGAVGRK